LRNENPGIANLISASTLKGFANRGTLSGFDFCLIDHPQGCRWRSNLGLKLANAFGVKIDHPKIACECHKVNLCLAHVF